MTVLVVLHCVGCRGEREFEQPPCVDGHDLDCPELACVDCGMALVLPWPDVVAESPAAPAELRAAG